jgi:hypothetical protein
MAYGKQLNGAENERQAAASLGALGDTLGETQVRGSPGAHPGITPGSPQLTTAAPDGGERRRPMLTRQNRKGNVDLTSSKLYPPPPSQERG